MTQRRTGLFWALFAAILAMLLCSVGLADGEERKLVLDDLPDPVTLLLSSEREGQLSIGRIGYLGIYARFDDGTTIDKVDFKLVQKDPYNNVISITDKHFEKNSVTISYSPIKVGQCTYTVTATIPDTEYSVSKDITFVVLDGDSNGPSSVVVNHDYFDDENVYIKEELIMPEDGGEPLIDMPTEALPSYMLNGCKRYLKATSMLQGMRPATCTCVFQRPASTKYHFTAMIMATTGNWSVRAYFHSKEQYRARKSYARFERRAWMTC